LVDNTEQVEVTVVESDRVSIFELKVAKEDTGRGT